MNLTDTKIKNAKLGEKPFKLFDGWGLYLFITPTGSKWWRLKYRFGGKEKRASLGVYPDVSLSEARSKCKTLRTLLTSCP
ncbi:MAG: Arm DNA-binding domain-containing protein [Gallionellaceae bacterium]